ncbi:MAG: M56 family metallopeptidase, partial [Sedimentisphaerales bacterium]|nr:M56 family metallopeptidase [Sedimentisphaerales bacterium]
MVDTINHIALSWWGWMAAMFWQVSLLIILIACIDILIKKWAWPRLRYALWLLVLLKLILPPCISMPGSFIARLQPMAGRVVESMTRERPVIEEPSAEIQYNHYQIVPAVMNSPQRTATGIPPRPRTFEGYASTTAVVESAPSVMPVWQSYAFVLWLLGIMILGSWLFSRLHRLRKSHPQAGTASSIPQSFHNMMLRCARQLKLRRIPRIVVTKKVVCPAVFGVFRPVLLMPKGYLSKLSRKDAEHMLLHELAHIKRGDPVVHSFYLLLQIVYWFNPLLWLARRQLIHLRELCCDATVAGLLKNRTCEYRETLIDVARRFLTRPVEPGIGLLGLFEDT